MGKKKILYIEDEPSLGQIIFETLQHRGFEVVWEQDGANVMRHFSNFQPDICVVDVMLPNIDGFELCKLIRQKDSNIPIIFLTARVELADLVKGFEAGGTDYIRKPVSLEELFLRIQNQLKIHGSNNARDLADDDMINEEIGIGTYTFYPNRFELKSPSGLSVLSNREGEILRMLVEKGTRIIERKDILLQVWGDDSFFNSRTLDVYIKKLRNYFKKDPNVEIQTLRGRGYLLLVRRDA